jgi:hypothetical protein
MSTPFPIRILNPCVLFAVNGASNDNIASFLAKAGVERYCYARAIPAVSESPLTRFSRSLSYCRLQDQYAHGFSAFKPDKKLRWLPHLGTINLELEFEDRIVTADVAPLEAAFIELFADKGINTIYVVSRSDIFVARCMDHGRTHFQSGICRQKRGTQGIGDLG